MLQVYYLVLLFGFQGKYRVRGGEIELGDLTDRVRDSIRRSGIQKETELSPHGQPARLTGGRDAVEPVAHLGGAGRAGCGFAHLRGHGLVLVLEGRQT